jgi:hypothetical protein
MQTPSTFHRHHNIVMPDRFTYRFFIFLLIIPAQWLMLCESSEARQNQDTDSPVQLLYSGYHKVYFETANRQRFGSEIPLSLLRWELQPTIGLYGIPMSMNLLYTTEDNEPGSNAGMFQFGLSLSSDQIEQTIRDRIRNEMDQSVQQLLELDPSTATLDEVSAVTGRMDQLAGLEDALDTTPSKLDELRNLGLITSAERLALRFPMLGIGSSNPHYSKYMLQGVIINGFHAEYMPGRAYIGTNIGNIRRPAGLTGMSQFGVFENERRVYAGRVGIGRPFGRHIHLMGVFVDESRQDETLNGNLFTLPPEMKNVVTGLKFRMGAFSEALDLQGELAGSFLTRDPDAPESDEPYFSNIPVISSLINSNISSFMDVSGMTEANLRLAESGTRFRGGLQYIGPGYVNLAAPSLRNDRVEYYGGIEQPFFRRQMTMSANFRTEQNNLDRLKNFTRSSTRFDIQMALNFRDLPWLRLQFIPVTQKNKAVDSFFGSAGEFTYKTTIFNVFSGYTRPVGSVLSTTAVNLSTQFINSGLNNADATTVIFGLNQSIGFGSGTLNAGYQRFSFSRLETSLNRNDITLSGSYRMKGSWLNEAGFRNSGGENQVRITGIWYRSSLPVPLLGTLEVMIEHNRFANSTLGDSDFGQTRFTTSLTRSW